jgi:hypothetical protein
MCRGESHFSQKWFLANVGKSGASVQHGLANVGESDTFPKKAVLVSTRICQKWRISGEYSNLLNSLASGHSLVIWPSVYETQRSEVICVPDLEKRCHFHFIKKASQNF